jgi:hypothetical protein
MTLSFLVKSLKRPKRSPLAEDMLVGVRAIAAYLDRSTGSAHRLLTAGEIPGGQLGGRWCASKSALDRRLADLTSARKP